VTSDACGLRAVVAIATFSTMQTHAAAVDDAMSTARFIASRSVSTTKRHLCILERIIEPKYVAYVQVQFEFGGVPDVAPVIVLHLLCKLYVGYL